MMGDLLPLDFTQDPNAQRAGTTERVYRAVSILRRAGHVVYRQGLQHIFDGKIASTKQILELAEAEERA